jgi:hypothetical protein
MDIALPALAVALVAFAAFCVWLDVWIYNRRKRWAKWTVVGLMAILPVLYVASFGPACWITSWANGGADVVNTVYEPIIWLLENGPDSWAAAVDSYSRVGASEKWHWEKWRGKETISKWAPRRSRPRATQTILAE